MTDDQIEKAADKVQESIIYILGHPQHLATPEDDGVRIEEREAEVIAAEATRSFIRACYLSEFKRLRAKGQLLDPLG
jgi:hypothetical protein